MWKNFNPNPQRRNVGDCAVRAIAAALNVSWEEAFLYLVEIAEEMYDMPSANSVWGACLHGYGFIKQNLPYSCADEYTVAEFAAEHSEGVYVLALSGHVVAVIDGDYFDSWDSGNEIVIYYWKEI